MKKIFILVMLCSVFGCKKKDNSNNLTYDQCMDSLHLKYGIKYSYAGDTIIINPDRTITEYRGVATITAPLTIESIYSTDLIHKSKEPILYIRLFSSTGATGLLFTNQLRFSLYNMVGFTYASDSSIHLVQKGGSAVYVLSRL